MRKLKLLFIAPYSGLIEPIWQALRKYDDVDATVKLGDMKDGELIAKSMLPLHFDAIISRGGTAQLIRQAVKLPVIDIPVTVYDILRSIKMAENYNKRFAIAGYPAITQCAQVLCDLLSLRTHIITFDKMEEIPGQIHHLRKQGYELLICDTIGSTTASQFGMNSILISSWIESIEQAIDNAHTLLLASSYYYQQKEIFQSILTSGDDSLLIYDNDGQLWFSSIADPKMQNMFYSMIQPFLEDFRKTSGQRIEKRAGSMIYSIQNRHFTSEEQQFTVVTISRKECLLLEGDNSISIYNKKSTEEDFRFSYNSANYIGNIRDTIGAYCEVQYPVLILGESGTGKDKAASLIYTNSFYQDHPLYTIDCALLGERRWSTLLSSSNSPLNSLGSTLFFKNVNALSVTQMDKLISYIELADTSRQNRLLFSYLETPDNPSDKSLICDYLLNRLHCLTLRLPPLRERKQDIPSILTLYLNQLNLEMGKPIIGFEPDALKLMQDFSWPQNLNQLQRLLRQLVVLTNDSYITKENVLRLLKNESYSPSHPWKEEPAAALDLNRTLDEINYDIIRAVLQEEHMSKEKAAKRLGIGRSTLWRILKSHEEPASQD